MESSNIKYATVSFLEIVPYCGYGTVHKLLKSKKEAEKIILSNILSKRNMNNQYIWLNAYNSDKNNITREAVLNISVYFKERKDDGNYEITNITLVFGNVEQSKYINSNENPDKIPEKIDDTLFKTIVKTNGNILYYYGDFDKINDLIPEFDNLSYTYQFELDGKNYNNMIATEGLS